MTLPLNAENEGGDFLWGRKRLSAFKLAVLTDEKPSRIPRKPNIMSAPCLRPKVIIGFRRRAARSYGWNREVINEDMALGVTRTEVIC